MDQVTDHSTSARLGLSRIGQIGLPVRDLDRAVEFYRDRLGMAFLFRVPDLAFFDCAGVRLMLNPSEASEFVPSSAVIFFKVDDLAQVCATFAERGVSFLDAPHLIARMPDHELWMAFLKDSEGNTLGLMAEVPLS